MTVAMYYHDRSVNGRAVLKSSPTDEPTHWIARVDGYYYRCTAESIDVEQLQPDQEVESLSVATVRPRRFYRHYGNPLTAVIH